MSEAAAARTGDSAGSGMTSWAGRSELIHLRTVSAGWGGGWGLAASASRAKAVGAGLSTHPESQTRAPDPSLHPCSSRSRQRSGTPRRRVGGAGERPESGEAGRWDATWALRSARTADCPHARRRGAPRQRACCERRAGRKVQLAASESRCGSGGECSGADCAVPSGSIQPAPAPCSAAGNAGGRWRLEGGTTMRRWPSFPHRRTIRGGGRGTGCLAVRRLRVRYASTRTLGPPVGRRRG